MRLYDITVFVSYVGGVCGCAFLSLELVLEVAVAFQTPPWFHICIKCVLCRLAAAQAALHYRVMRGVSSPCMPFDGTSASVCFWAYCA